MKMDWITRGLIKSVNTKIHFIKKIQKNPDNVLLLNEFKKYRTKFNELLKTTKRNYYKSLINNNKNCRNKLWSCLKDIHAQKPNNHQIDEIKTAEGCIVQFSSVFI